SKVGDAPKDEAGRAPVTWEMTASFADACRRCVTARGSRFPDAQLDALSFGIRRRCGRADAVRVMHLHLEPVEDPLVVADARRVDSDSALTPQPRLARSGHSREQRAPRIECEAERDVRELPVHVVGARTLVARRPDALTV